jgi:hypothetical protein
VTPYWAQRKLPFFNLNELNVADSTVSFSVSAAAAAYNPSERIVSAHRLQDPQVSKSFLLLL